MSRPRILLIAALGLAAVLARVFWTNPAPTESPGVPPPPEMARTMPSADASPTPAANRVAAPPPNAAFGTEDPQAMAARAEKAQAAAAKLRHQAQFPPNSRRIEDNVDPIVATRAVKERMSPPGQGRKPTLVVFASSLSYEAPNPIILFAKFIRDENDWAPRADAEIAGELRSATGHLLAEVELRDDGQERDLEARDGVFTTRLTPDPEDLDAWDGLVRVKLYGETADGDRRSATTRFYYGVPSAKLTGYYKDELVQGHLQLSAEVEVHEVGEYRLEATLGGPQGLIAWSSNTVALEPGVSFIPLTFWGLALRQANQPGPYFLTAIALANVTYKPPQLNDAIGSDYRTAPYKPQDFSAEPFNDPQLLDKADRYDARARGETTRVP